MSDFTKIAYYDLRWEGLKGRLKAPLVGRTEELARMSRVVKRSLNNNCLVVGPSGIGKTALIHGWAKNMLSHAGENGGRPIIQLDAESFQGLHSSASVPLQKYKEALETLPSSVIFIDGFGQLIYNKPA